MGKRLHSVAVSTPGFETNPTPGNPSSNLGATCFFALVQQLLPILYPSIFLLFVVMTSRFKQGRSGCNGTVVNLSTVYYV